MYLHPYKNGSQGAKELANALGIKQIKREGSKFKGSKDKLVINWGSSDMSAEVAKYEVLNKPEAVAIASNKLEFFKKIARHNELSRFDAHVSIPHWMDSKKVAFDYFHAGYTLVCRTVLNGHSGAGIVLVDPMVDPIEKLPDCSLYVQYKPKKSEYRIHVLNGEVVDIQKKMRRVDIPDDQINWKIRNHDNGFIYARNEVAENTPPSVCNNAIKAVNVCGLDFGAVDVIWNERDGLAYVLEINTAPGLTGETLEGYRKRFEEIGNDWKSKKVITNKVSLNGVLVDELYNDGPAIPIGLLMQRWAQERNALEARLQAAAGVR